MVRRDENRCGRKKMKSEKDRAKGDGRGSENKGVDERSCIN